ncbi:MAG: hypothetical protein Q4D04_08645, partial [Clostridia bacterium]|nr:hypothetical protein [Clostridia bacterium]
MAKSFSKDDMNDNRILGGLGYLIFFLPLITCPKSKYGRFCANQGLIILIAQIAIFLVFRIL